MSKVWSAYQYQPPDDAVGFAIVTVNVDGHAHVGGYFLKSAIDSDSHAALRDLLQKALASLEPEK